MFDTPERYSSSIYYILHQIPPRVVFYYQQAGYYLDWQLSNAEEETRKEIKPKKARALFALSEV